PVAREPSRAAQPCADDNYGWIVSVKGFRYDVPRGSPFERPEPADLAVKLDAVECRHCGTLPPRASVVSQEFAGILRLRRSMPASGGPALRRHASSDALLLV